MGMIDIFISYLKKTKNNNLINKSQKQNELIQSNPPKISNYLDNNNNNNINNIFDDNPENNIEEIKFERNITKNRTKSIIIKKKQDNKNISVLNPQNSIDNINKSDAILEEKNKENKEMDDIENNDINININYNINIDIEEYLKTDLDDMDYDDAIRCDKRTFCKYFWEKM